MIQILIFILPTFLALIIHDKINQGRKTLYNIFKIFGVYCCLINLIMMSVLFLYRAVDFAININIQMFDFVYKYFLLSCIIAGLLPIIIKFIRLNIDINIIFKEKVFENEKNN